MMYVKNQTVFRYMTSIAVIFLLMFSLSIVAFPQRTDGEDENKIMLEKNKRVNGYKVSERGEGEFYVNVLGATNPLTGKRLNGEYKFVYRCAQITGLIIVAVILAKGYVREKIRCNLENDPYLRY